MASEATYDVFLSYAAPHMDAVEELARLLQSAGLKPYFDRWEVSLGSRWQEELEEGLNRSQTFARLIGSSVLDLDEGRKMMALLLRAREKGIRMIPVLLPGASGPRLPIFLRRLAWVDFRSGLADPVALHHLIAAIKGGPEWLEWLEWLERMERQYRRYVLLDNIKRKRHSQGIPWLLPRTIIFHIIRLPRLGLPRFDFRPRLKNVWLAIAAPPRVARNCRFVARFSAYTQEYKNHVTKVATDEAPETKLYIDLHTCQWEPGTKVTVMLSADHLHIEESSQSFIWDGKWKVIRFDVSVPDSIDEGVLILKFDVFVEGLNIAKLRPELKIVHSQTTHRNERELAITKAPDKAFASYASLDRREVLGRIRSLQIFTRVDVFLDCLSIHPGEPWKARIKDEIEKRDIFWLFWSRNALQSSWVDWEWRTALAIRDLAYIQPHPLEGPDTAPPPAELAALQFGTLYESLLGQMRSSWWHRRITQCRRAARRVVGSYWFLASILLVVIAYFVWFKWLN